MTIQNSKPFVLNTVYHPAVKGNFDPLSAMKALMVEPIFTPLTAGTSVTVSDGKTNYDEDAVLDQLLNCCGAVSDPQSEAFVRDLYSQALLNYDKTPTLLIQETYVAQAINVEKLPAPSPTVLYTPAQDIIPSAKEFLAGKCEISKFFASLACYARPETLGIWFMTEQVFEEFKTYVRTCMTGFSQFVSSDTNQMFSDFDNLNLQNLTESIMLRNNDGENNEEYSFARMLVYFLMDFIENNQNVSGVLPFNIGELFCPKTIVFVNVEKHARSSAKKIADEWTIIENSLNNKPLMISKKQLSSLTATQRLLKKIQGAAASGGGMDLLTRSARIRFKSKAPTTVDMAKIIRKIINKMALVAKSENIFKETKMTFQRPNRRDPDDFNKQGKMVSQKYKPDIHLYVDTSGSISEENYEESIKACIKMAKKLNVNLYFNSFSHILSPTTKLHVKDKPLAAIYREFQKVDKVSGGTNYENIWHFINRSKKRKREISLLITDFEYHPPNRYIRHPKYLFYIPCSKMNWNNITYYAKDFVEKMQHNDPQIRQKLLF